MAKKLEQTKFQLSEITGTENYFYHEINERKPYIRKLNKYITIFEYIDKILIILSATSGEVSIISFISIVGVPVGIASASLTIILNEKDKYDKMKYKIINENENNI